VIQSGNWIECLVFAITLRLYNVGLAVELLDIVIEIWLNPKIILFY
jgi:hypothetical protein